MLSTTDTHKRTQNTSTLTLTNMEMLITLALTHASDEQKMKALNALTGIDVSSQIQHDSDTLLNKRDAAEFLGISRATLDRLVKDGKLTKIQLGGRHSKNLFKKSDLQSFRDSKISYPSTVSQEVIA